MSNLIKVNGTTLVFKVMYVLTCFVALGSQFLPINLNATPLFSKYSVALLGMVSIYICLIDYTKKYRKTCQTVVFYQLRKGKEDI